MIQLVIVDSRANISSVLCWYIIHNICLNRIFLLNWKVVDIAPERQKIHAWKCYNTLIFSFSTKFIAESVLTVEPK
jgi:hypothetical protein